MVGKVYWAYETIEAKDKGAIPPASHYASYSIRENPRSKNLIREEALGRKIVPSDCGPMRVIGHYGFIVKSPGNVTIKRNLERERLKKFENNHASYGYANITGDTWPFTESGLVASWISGSEYVKIHTGIVVFFDSDAYLFQGPIPNKNHPRSKFQVMAGIEYGSRQDKYTINGKEMFMAYLNVIIKIPPLGESINISRGEELLWFYPVLKPKELSLQKISGDEIK